jgi:hypothetical protein
MTGICRGVEARQRGEIAAEPSTPADVERLEQGQASERRQIAAELLANIEVKFLERVWRAGRDRRLAGSTWKG